MAQYDEIAKQYKETSQLEIFRIISHTMSHWIQRQGRELVRGGHRALRLPMARAGVAVERRRSDGDHAAARRQPGDVHGPVLLPRDLRVGAQGSRWLLLLAKLHARP